MATHDHDRPAATVVVDEFYASLRTGDERRSVEILADHPSVAMSRTTLLFGGQSGAPEDFAGRSHCALTAAANMGARVVTAALLDAGAATAGAMSWATHDGSATARSYPCCRAWIQLRMA